MNIRWKPALILLTVFSIGGVQARSQDITSRVVVGAGGVNCTNQHYRVAATLGQPAIGPATAGLQSITQGFWQPLSRTTAGGRQHPTTGSPAPSPELSAFPNLFTESIQLSLRVPHAGHISLILYDLLGKPVRTLLDAEQPEGTFNLQLGAEDLSTGHYTVVLITGGEQRSVPIRLVK